MHSRAIQQDNRRWSNLALPDASMTWMQIDKYGFVKILQLGANSYLPNRLLTVTDSDRPLSPQSTVGGRISLQRDRKYFEDVEG